MEKSWNFVIAEKWENPVCLQNHFDKPIFQPDGKWCNKIQQIDYRKQTIGT